MVQVSWDQGLKGEALKRMSQCMRGEDQGVRISLDQDLKGELLIWRVLGLTGDDL